MGVKPSPIRVASLHLRAGILEAPPHMVEAISDWIVSVVASEALRQIKQRRVSMSPPNGREWLTMTSGPFSVSEEDARASLQEWFAEFDDVEQEALRLGGQVPTGSAPDDYFREFPLDLSGWRHQQIVESRLSARRAQDPRSLWMFDKLYDPIKVVVYRTLKEQRGTGVAATWRSGFLTVWGLPAHLHRRSSFRPYIKDLQQTIRHELQHLAQDLLREATGVDEAGGHRTRVYPHTEGLHPADEHALRDVEFHTRLQDAIGVFQDLSLPEGTIPAAIRAYTGTGSSAHGIEPSSFFATLRKYDRRKWTRAVSEFVRSVQSGHSKKAAVLIPQEWMDAQVAEVQAYLDRPFRLTAAEEMPEVLEGLRALLLAIPERLRQFTDSPYVFGPRLPEDITKAVDSVKYTLDHLRRGFEIFGRRPWKHSPLDGMIKDVCLRKISRRFRTVRDVLDVEPQVNSVMWLRLLNTTQDALSPDAKALVKNGRVSDPVVVEELRGLDFPQQAAKVISYGKTYAGDPVEATRAFFESLQLTWGQEPLPEDRGIFREVSIGKAKLTILDPDVRVEVDERVIDRCLEAKRLLERRGLGAVWYGKVLYMSQKAGVTSGTDEQKATLKALGHPEEVHYSGAYSAQKDTVYLHTSPGEAMVGTLVHELGHRYWAKFMDQRRRAHFTRYVRTPARTYEGETEGGEVDEWGREKPVAPVSQYGGTNVEEAFAEAFMAYVLGPGFSWQMQTKMNRDQLESFRAVIEG